MNKTVRNILAVLAGLVLACLVITGIESIGHRIYPQPPKLDFRNKEQMLDYIRHAPPGALLFVAVRLTRRADPVELS